MGSWAASHIIKCQEWQSTTHLHSVDDLAYIQGQIDVSGIQPIKHCLPIIETKVVGTLKGDCIAIGANDLPSERFRWSVSVQYDHSRLYK